MSVVPNRPKFLGTRKGHTFKRRRRSTVSDLMEGLSLKTDAAHSVSDLMEALTLNNSSSTAPTFAGSQKMETYLRIPARRIILLLLDSEKYASRIEYKDAIYCAAVLEYLIVELLGLAGNNAHDENTFRITPNHIQAAVEMDAELTNLFQPLQFGTRTWLLESNLLHKVYVLRLMTNIHPDVSISGEAFQMINYLADVVFEKIVSISSRLSENKTITPREIRSAVELVFSGELAKQAVCEGIARAKEYISSCLDW